MRSELHVFVIWDKGRYLSDKIKYVIVSILKVIFLIVGAFYGACQLVCTGGIFKSAGVSGKLVYDEFDRLTVENF